MPGGEVQVTDTRMHDDGTRIDDATSQCLALAAVQFGDIQVLGVPVQPVQFATHPIDGDALQAMGIVPDDSLLSGGISSSASPYFALKMVLAVTSQKYMYSSRISKSRATTFIRSWCIRLY